MASSNEDTYFKFKPKGSTVFPDHYEGFLMPRLGRTPFKIIDDPAVIAKKNQMRQALRDEYTKRIYNPYRWASGVSGHVFDPALQRYYTLSRVGWQYYRPGPKMNFVGLMFFFVVPGTIFYIAETMMRKEEVRKRSGLVAYEDRKNKWAT